MIDLFYGFDLDEYDIVGLVDSIPPIELSELPGDNYYYVYRIVNNINGKYYIGVHHGRADDCYLGSGKVIRSALDKYGSQNFTKQILLITDSENEAYEYESQLVTKELVDDPNCYNIRLGGKGGWDHIDYKSLLTTDHQSNAGKHHNDNLTPEMRSEIARKSYKTAKTINGGVHPMIVGVYNRSSEDFHRSALLRESRLSPEYRSNRAKKAAETQRRLYNILAYNNEESTKKRMVTMSELWVFYNPSTCEYRVHNLYWHTRNKLGFTDRLSALENWTSYAELHDIDPKVIEVDPNKSIIDHNNRVSDTISKARNKPNYYAIYKDSDDHLFIYKKDSRSNHKKSLSYYCSFTDATEDIIKDLYLRSQ